MWFGWGDRERVADPRLADVPSLGRLVERANRLLENRLDFFDVSLDDSAPAIRWNYEYSIGRPTPMTFAPAVDYRDFSVTGDAKVVWEPNRHQHLAVLARAYAATGDARYADKVVEQIESWMDQCPYGLGMNWRSPLELAIRIINWVFALDLIGPSASIDPAFRARLMSVVYRHLWEIDRNYSRYSSANNHCIGEACGVYIGSAFFAGLKAAARWRDGAAAILSREIQRQTLDDGGHCELSPSYHLFVLEFFLLAGVAARRTGRDFDRAYWQRLESMFDFTAALLEGGDACPSFGDGDDGFVLDLEDEDTRVRSLMGVGACLFGRDNLRAASGDCGERLYWLLGPAAHREFFHDQSITIDEPIESRALSDSGYYLLQSGGSGQSDRISVAFDCGSLGFGSIAAHGHADALSFTLRIAGVEVLVDPGTYDYFTFADWRDYFRSTRAHNTIVVDGMDQSEMTGPFMWGRRAEARCLAWEPGECGGSVRGCHDGYSRLRDPVIHTRSVRLDGGDGTIVVEDQLEATSGHTAEFCLHFSERCAVEDLGANRIGVDFGVGRLELRLDSRLEMCLLRGQTDPIAGWVSRGYHHKTPTTTLVGSWRWTGKTQIVTDILLLRDGYRSGCSEWEREARAERSDVVSKRSVRGEDGSDDSRRNTWNV